MEQAIEILIHEMPEKFTRLHDLDNKFGFLLNVNQLIYKKTENLEEQCNVRYLKIFIMMMLTEKSSIWKYATVKHC